jgi:hypothetical protein
MDSHPHWRRRARTALEAYFHHRSYPRFTLTLLVTLAGVAGFLISRLLLHYGLEEMVYRYPLAVIGGYAVFLLQLRLWVEIERIRYNPEEVKISSETPLAADSEPLADRLRGSERDSWLDWLDVPDLMILDDGCLIGCFFALVIGFMVSTATAVFTFIMAGPELLAEVFLDAVVVSMLYRHLKQSAVEHWLGTAVRRTWVTVVVMAVALGGFGYVLAAFAPGCHSLGPALREITRQFLAAY